MIALICLIVGGIDVIAVIVLVIVASRAPMGWEDEDGFHEGIRGRK